MDQTERVASKTSPSRRAVLATAGAAGLAAALPAEARPAPTDRRPAPDGFLWGTAISAYQSEGNNTNADIWLLENVTPTRFKDRSADACDSYHRYGEDIAMAAGLGFNCYRFGLEWARIEPHEGRFSNAELDHYARVLQTCLDHGLKPVVTLNHFSVPLWFAGRGGWTAPDSPALFARYCDRVADRLGALIGMVTTFNEANLNLYISILPGDVRLHEAALPMIEAARQATGSPEFQSLLYTDPAVADPNLVKAHRLGYAAIKARRPDLPTGVTLTTHDVQATGPDSRAAEIEARLYGGWIEAAKDSADFVGVQTYTRIRVDHTGVLGPEPGAPLTAMGYEDYPPALGATIRWAHRAIGKPIYVTESGIGTDDDARRIGFIDEALTGVRACLDEGIPVHSYMYWSLLDNFEWSSGYGKHFGLVAVDLDTFERTPKPSAAWLGARARSNRI